MIDRFSDMRAKGVNTFDADATSGDIIQGKTAYVAGQKITGSLVPGGGSDNLNVYVQTNTPTSKAGVWLNTSGPSDNTFFTGSFTRQGGFIDKNFDYLTPGSEELGRVIVGDLLYAINSGSGSSYIYNIRTGQKVGTMNVPSITIGSSYYYSVGAVYYPADNKIYVFYASRPSSQSSSISYYAYDIETNTSVSYSSIFSEYNFYSYGRMVHVYGNYIYIALSASRTSSTGLYRSLVIRFDPESNTTTTFSPGSTVGKFNFAVGRYFYSLSDSGREIHRIDVEARTREVIYTIPTSSQAYIDAGQAPSRILVSGDKITILYSGTNFYSVYDMANGNLTDKVMTNLTYEIPKVSSFSEYGVLDEVSGMYYFIHYYVSVAYNVYAFQLSDYNLAGFEDGTVLIVQDYGGDHKALMQDSSELMIGVKDVYILESGELNGYLTYYGDGNEWKVLKNPNNTTATVTFDTNGGSSIVSQQVIIGQTATEPAAPSKSGYVFDGWTLNNEDFSFSTQIIEDCTLVAQYMQYEEVNYIQSMGTQYIDIGILPTLTTQVDCDFAFMQNEGSMLFGCGNNSGVKLYFGDNTTNFRSGLVSTGWDGAVSNILADTQRHSVLIESGSQELDGTQYGTQTLSNVNTNNKTITLFAYNTDWNGIINYALARIYSCKIYDNNILIRDFQPIKTETGEYCLLDKVNNKIYHNSGTGAFIGEGYEPTYISYIESTGRQYIDTGVKPSDNIKTQIEYYVLNPSLSDGVNSVLGSYNSNANRYQFRHEDNYFCGWGSSYVNNISSSKTLQNRVLTIENGTFAIDGTTITTISSSFNSNGINIYLFAINGNGTATNVSNGMRIYSCKIYEGTTLVKDLVPILDPQNVPCLLDKVSESFLYNAGTGSFIAGEVIE